MFHVTLGPWRFVAGQSTDHLISRVDSSQKSGRSAAEKNVLCKIAETRAETYDVAKRDFSRVAAAVEALEAEGWRVVKKGILPGQCTSDARHKGSPGPVRARIVFARRAPA